MKKCGYLTLHGIFYSPLGIEIGVITLLNFAFFIAISVVCLFALLCIRRWGYSVAYVGNQTRQRHATGSLSITAKVNHLGDCSFSGGYKRVLFGINENMGCKPQLCLTHCGLWGFAALAVSLMGRNHPVGIHSGRPYFWCLCIKAGWSLAFEIPTITPENRVRYSRFWLFDSLCAWTHAFKDRYSNGFYSQSV